jgi:hypothetical protein
MKARITSNINHPIGKAIAKCWNDVDFFSRSSGWDIKENKDVEKFVEETINYDWTINFCIGYGFYGVNLFLKIEDFCEKNKIHHKILNIGSYLSFGLLHNPEGTYDIEKATLKHASRRATFSHSFHHSYLDSRIINFGYLEGSYLNTELPHIHLLDLESVTKNVSFMIDNPSIKELSVQYKQPGNHRINKGIGPILPSLY